MFTKKTAALIALPLVALVLLGMRGISSSQPGDAKACPGTSATSGQSEDDVYIDGTNSTRDAAIRAAYDNAAAAAVEQAVKEGALLRTAVFGGSLAAIKTVCETSTATPAAAPLFAVANETALTQSLDHVLARASRVRASGSGSDVYGALVGAVESENASGTSKNGDRILILTDGVQAVAGQYLPALLRNFTDEQIARRIIGDQPVPRARGISVEMRGIGQGRGESFTTQQVRRIADVWMRVCKATHAHSCLVTSDLNY